MAESSTHDKFCIKLGAACTCYEIIISLLKHEYIIVNHENTEILGASSTIIGSLLKEFIFEAARAYRICEHSWRSMGINRCDKEVFIRSLQNLTRLRDVNEHWTDSINIKDRSRPVEHKIEKFIIDDTSFFIINGNLFFGNLRLDNDYSAIKRMNDLYGWKARAMKITVEK